MGDDGSNEQPEPLVVPDLPEATLIQRNERGDGVNVSAIKKAVNIMSARGCTRYLSQLLRDVEEQCDNSPQIIMLKVYIVRAQVAALKEKREQEKWEKEDAATTSANRGWRMKGTG